jgi:hypothetical protein
MTVICMYYVHGVMKLYNVQFTVNIDVQMYVILKIMYAPVGSYFMTLSG